MPAGSGRAHRITIGLDRTDEPTHGAQQLTLFFNEFYDPWCYLPLLAFVTFGREAEQYRCAAVLRSDKAVASDGAVALLSRLAAAAALRVPPARFLVPGRLGPGDVPEAVEVAVKRVATPRPCSVVGQGCIKKEESHP